MKGPVCIYRGMMTIQKLRFRKFKSIAALSPGILRNETYAGGLGQF